MFCNIIKAFLTYCVNLNGTKRRTLGQNGQRKTKEATQAIASTGVKMKELVKKQIQRKCFRTTHPKIYIIGYTP